MIFAWLCSIQMHFFTWIEARPSRFNLAARARGGRPSEPTRTVAMGYRSPDVFRTEAALDPLRERVDFRKLLAGLEKKLPAEPK